MNPGHMHSITPKIAAEIRKARIARNWDIFELRDMLNDHFTVVEGIRRHPPFSVEALKTIEVGIPHRINSVRAAAFVAVLGKDFWAQPERKSLWQKLFGRYFPYGREHEFLSWFGLDKEE